MALDKPKDATPLKLRPMDPSRYPAFERYSIGEYAQSNIDSGRWPATDALQKSKQAYRELLPEGLDTKDHTILELIADELAVGVLWIHADRKSAIPSAYIYDIEIEAQYRGKGYGKQAMLALERWCLQQGLKRIGLNVFAFNKAAIGLYESLGFQITNFQMKKDL